MWEGKAEPSVIENNVLASVCAANWHCTFITLMCNV